MDRTAHDGPGGCYEPIPRERWAEHPRFATQTLLLGSHASFRRISEALLAASPATHEPASGDLVGASLAARQRMFDQWQWSMRSHEHYEEQKLYPFLRHRFGVTTAQLEAGHEDLHAIERELRAAADAGDETGWAAEMERYDHALDQHLGAEEDLVIPCLLALSPAEFRAYYDGSATSVVQGTACC